MKSVKVLLLGVMLLTLTNCNTIKSLADAGLFSNRWDLASLAGFDLSSIQNLPFLNFDKEGMKISGSDGCNKFSGGFDLKRKFSVSDVASTKKACSGNIGDLASKFMNILQSGNKLDVNDSGMLELKKDDDVLATFKKGFTASGM